LARRREPAPEPATPEPARAATDRQQEHRGEVTVLEVDRDGPEVLGAATQEPAREAAADSTEHSRTEPAVCDPEREPGRRAAGELEAASEPTREEAGRPFAHPEVGDEREAGE
jgi:hypothetical protein